MSDRVPTIYLDATEAYWSGLTTGIQRVVRNLAHRTDRIGERTGNGCRVIVCGLTGPYDATELVRTSGWRPRAPERALGASVSKLRRMLERIVSPRGAVYRLVRATWRLVRWPRLRQERRATMAWEKSLEFVSFRPGDVLVLADAFWGRWGSRAVDAAERAVGEGIPVIVLLYDLFPVTHGDMVEDENVESFIKFLPRVLALSSGILTISTTMAETVRAVLRDLDPRFGSIPVDYFYLGHDFRPTAVAHSPAEGFQPRVLAAMNGRYYLAVGTIEIRKGYAQLLDAFDERWRRGDPLSLCIVGRPGWKAQEVLERLTTHPELGRRLFYVPYASDAELASLYRHCQAVVLCSVAEGFGLPLVEAMGSGARVIANDIPIFREIGGDYPIYFRGGGKGLDAAITEMERRIASGWKPARRDWINWDQAADQFAAALSRLVTRSRQSQAGTWSEVASETAMS